MPLPIILIRPYVGLENNACSSAKIGAWWVTKLAKLVIAYRFKILLKYPSEKIQKTRWVTKLAIIVIAFIYILE